MTLNYNPENLTKLANYLGALPEGYKHFEMSVFAVVGDVDEERPLECAKVTDLVNVCDSVACAVGHGPSAGIPVPEEFCTFQEFYDENKDEYVNIRTVRWNAYSTQFLCPSYSDAWYFMFGPEWAAYHNTPQEAAKRIRYIVDHNGQPPESFDRYSPRSHSMEF